MKYDEEKLWSAVVTRGIQDAVGKNPKLREEAINWLNSKSFETVCELANLNFTRMKNMYGNFMSKKQKELKMLLIDNIKECVSYLLPNGEFYREKTYIGDLNGNTITVKIVGKEAGDWRNFTEGTGGDIIDLWILIKGDIYSARKWLNKKSKNGEKKGRKREEKIFSVKQYLSDQSPIPEDIIAPRILTPGGLLVIGGTPKVGKSYFLLSLLAHLAAGVSFLKMKSARPLKIIYLQNEMEYNYIRERIQQIITNQRLPNLAEENLIVTTKMRLTLNDEGIERIKDIIGEKFKTIDLIVLDSLDYENMFSGLQSRVEKLRSVINPMAGIIITRHTRKVSTATLAKSPFQALIGANALRSFYTSGMVMFQPNKRANVLQVVYELRNGKSIPAKFISRVNGRWQNSKVIATA